MKPRGGLSLSTRWGDFYGYKLNLVALSQFMGFWRKGWAFGVKVGLFKSLFLHLQRPCKKGCIPSKAGIHPFLSILMEEAL